MLATKFRLTGSKNFKRVQDEGRMFQSEDFGLAYLSRGDENPSRFAFIVSTKIAKDAVDRNRFKRALSEAVRLSSIDVKNGFDVVFLAKTSIAKKATSDIMREVRSALRESGILR